MTHDEPVRILQTRSTFSTWIGVVLIFAFFGLLALVAIDAAPRGTKYEKKRAKARAEKLRTAREETTTALTTYGWVDKAKGVAHIPINDAMKLTVAELAQKKPALAYPIATPEAQAPQNAAPTNPTPGPSPSPSASATPKPTSVTGPKSENRGQPAAAANPPPAPPGTQPGAAAKPASSPPSAAAKGARSPSVTPSPSAPGRPLPVRGKTP